jgi:Pyruvate/2-oxoacid:ferredoxin oxidoreductase gamma subunit
MEIEIMLTGIGGQGIQLLSQVLARAAALENREVMFLGTYGGNMRGGNTDSTLVIADQPISAPPMLSKVGVAMAMHHEFWGPVEAKLRPGAVVLLNSTVFVGEVAAKDVLIYRIPATQLASDLGSPLCASMVLLGAYAALSNIVSLESLITAMIQSLPPYRQQHVELNRRALTAGYESQEPNTSPAWSRAGVEA